MRRYRGSRVSRLLENLGVVAGVLGRRSGGPPLVVCELIFVLGREVLQRFMDGRRNHAGFEKVYVGYGCCPKPLDRGIGHLRNGCDS